MSKNQSLALSIIIPAFNEEIHLKNCLTSIENQISKPFEVIVVDNNSTDNTVKVAKSFKFVKVLHESKQGIVFARNKGFNSAKGDLLCRIDSDTILPKDWTLTIEKFYKSLNTETTCITGGTSFSNLPFKQLSYFFHRVFYFNMNKFFLGFYNAFGSNMVIPRNVAINSLANACVDTDVHEDIDLSIHLIQNGYKIKHLNNLRVKTIMRGPWHQVHTRESRYSMWRKTLLRHNLLNASSSVYLAMFFMVGAVAVLFQKTTKH